MRSTQKSGSVAEDARGQRKAVNGWKGTALHLYSRELGVEVPKHHGVSSLGKGSVDLAIRFLVFLSGSNGMAETSTIQMQDRELFAAMAMQAIITRQGCAAGI